MIQKETTRYENMSVKDICNEYPEPRTYFEQWLCGALEKLKEEGVCLYLVEVDKRDNRFTVIYFKENVNQETIQIQEKYEHYMYRVVGPSEVTIKSTGREVRCIYCACEGEAKDIIKFSISWKGKTGGFEKMTIQIPRNLEKEVSKNRELIEMYLALNSDRIEYSNIKKFFRKLLETNELIIVISEC